MYLRYGIARAQHKSNNPDISSAGAKRGLYCLSSLCASCISSSPEDSATISEVETSSVIAWCSAVRLVVVFSVLEAVLYRSSLIYSLSGGAPEVLSLGSSVSNLYTSVTITSFPEEEATVYCDSTTDVDARLDVESLNTAATAECSEALLFFVRDTFLRHAQEESRLIATIARIIFFIFVRKFRDFLPEFLHLLLEVIYLAQELSAFRNQSQVPFSFVHQFRCHKLKTVGQFGDGDQEWLDGAIDDLKIRLLLLTPRLKLREEPSAKGGGNGHH